MELNREKLNSRCFSSTSFSSPTLHPPPATHWLPQHAYLFPYPLSLNCPAE